MRTLHTSVENVTRKTLKVKTLQHLNINNIHTYFFIVATKKNYLFHTFTHSNACESSVSTKNQLTG